MDLFQPIQQFADLATYDWLELAPHSYWGDAVDFFIYDTVKISLLLVAVNFVIAVIRYYFPIEKARNILSGREWHGIDYLLAAMLGVVTPFCSCSSIPLFVGFVSAGIPLGVTFTFLIASPLVNEASLFLFPSIFGFKMTLIYNILGIIISVIAGMIIQRLKMEGHVNPAFLKFKTNIDAIKENGGVAVPLKKLLSIWWHDGAAISKSIFPYVLLGVGLGALIHGFVPRDFVQAYLSPKEWWTVPLAALMGAPLYANSVSVIPVVEALTGKGVPLGTSLAFMTATVTLSIPGLLILKKAMDWKLLSAFFTVTLIGIMIIGYFFNTFLF